MSPPPPQFATLLTFKAGRMKAQGPNASGQYTITGDSKKGQCSVVRSTSANSEGEGVVHFQWAERRGVNSVKEDLIIFPSEATFRKVDTKRGGAGSSNGIAANEDRVYVLEYIRGARDRRYFYYLQDIDSKDDVSNVAKINLYFNDPAAASAAAKGTASSSTSEAVGTASSAAPSSSSSSTTTTTNLLPSTSALTSSSSASASNADTSVAFDNDALMNIMTGLNDTMDVGGGGAGSEVSAANVSATANTSSSADLNMSLDIGSHGISPLSFATPGPVNASGSAGGVQAFDLQSILQNMGIPQQQIQGGVTPGPNATANSGAGNNVLMPPPAPSKAAGSASSGGGALTLGDLNFALNSLGGGAIPSASSNATSLSDIASPANILSSKMLEDPEIVSKLTKLLPEGQRSREDLIKNLGSPQIREAIGNLQNALGRNGGGSYNEVIANCDLGGGGGASSSEAENNALMRGDNVLAFLERVIAKVEREKEGGGEKKKEGEEEQK